MQNQNPSRHIIGISDMKFSNTPGDILVTHALGSCIGIAIHDPVRNIGGMLHYMLPLSKIDSEKAAKKPLMFGDTGIPLGPRWRPAWRPWARSS